MLKDTIRLFFQRAGLTYSRRSQKGLSIRVMAQGCIFADKGPAIFVEKDSSEKLLALLAITNSSAFQLLVELQMAFGSYEVGVIQRTPVHNLTPQTTASLTKPSTPASTTTLNPNSVASAKPSTPSATKPDVAATKKRPWKTCKPWKPNS